MSRATTSTDTTRTDVELAFVLLDLAWFTALVEARVELEPTDVAEQFCAIARANLTEGARLVRSVGHSLIIVSSTNTAAIMTAIQLPCRCFTGTRVDSRTWNSRNDSFATRG